MSCFSFLRRSDLRPSKSAIVDAFGDDEVTLAGDVNEKGGAPSQPNATTTQLTELRAEMSKEGLDWYLVFTDDEHASEYTAACDQQRSFISGFTGSAGTVIVHKDTSAHAFIDGRYWIQAGEQLDHNWTLHKIGAPGVENWDEWIVKTVQQGEKVGFDAKTISYGEQKEMCKLRKKQS